MAVGPFSTTANTTATASNPHAGLMLGTRVTGSTSIFAADPDTHTLVSIDDIHNEAFDRKKKIKCLQRVD